MNSSDPGFTKRTFLMAFESMGNNCEFGTVQRLFKAEPLSLLRWVGINTIEQLLSALHNKFEGFGELENVDHMKLEGWPDYAAVDRRYGLYFHTDFQPNETQPEHAAKMLDNESKRMRFLRDKFLQDLANGHKIFVFRRKEPLSDVEAEALWQAVSSCGNATLLYVNEDSSRPNGYVEPVKNRLFKGYIDRLSNENPPVINFEAWVLICESAYNLANSAKLVFQELPDV
jgi:hypothetical protein